MAKDGSDKSKEKYYEELLHSLNKFFHDLHHDLTYIRAFTSSIRLLRQEGKLSDAELDRFLNEIEEKTEDAYYRSVDLMNFRSR